MSNLKHLSSPRHRSNRPAGPRHRQHHARTTKGNILMNAVSDLIRKDPFGILWLILIFLAASTAKWWYISTEMIDAKNCVICVVAIAIAIAILVSILLTVFWIFSSDQGAIGIGFYFTMGALGILCSLIHYKLTHIIVSKLYYAGKLTWLEDQSGELLDQFVPHLSGLYLSTLMLYLAIRMVFASGSGSRLAIISLSVVLLGVSAVLLLLGIKLY